MSNNHYILNQDPAAFEPIWIEREDQIGLSGLSGEGEIRFNLYSGPDKFLEYFPSCVFVFSDGLCCSIVEFSQAEETVTVSIPVSVGQNKINLTFQCEQARCPATLGIGPDQRSLGGIVTGLHFAPGPVRAPTRPGSGHRAYGGLKHFDLRPHDTPEPIFIIGCYRSGTSILAWALGQHPNVFPMEETNWLPTLCHGAVAAYAHASSAARSATRLYDVSQAEFLQWQGAAIDQLHRTICRDRWQKLSIRGLQYGVADEEANFQLMRSRYSPKRRWVDATPENTSVGHHLAQMFPQGKFIYALRKPSEVIRSLRSFDRAGGARQSLDKAAATWELMNQWAYELRCDLGPDRVLIAPFETLKTAPADHLANIWRFLDEPTFHKSLETLDQKINSSRVDRREDETEAPADAERMARLEAIHQAILADTPFADVPWTIPPNVAQDRNGHITRLIRTVTS